MIENSELENQKKEFQPWIEKYQNKQSDQLNAMIGVGVGFIFGYFQVLEEGAIFSVFCFPLLILTIFSYFYSRYWYYLIAETATLHQLKIKTNSIIEKAVKVQTPWPHSPMKLWAENVVWIKKAMDLSATEG